jgi:hypothetical protein
MHVFPDATLANITRQDDLSKIRCAFDWPTRSIRAPRLAMLGREARHPIE